MKQPDVSPEREAAAQAEGALLMQAENTYLKQRVVALSARVRELLAECERLTPEPTEGRHRADLDPDEKGTPA